jgi:hypothetical protein
LEVFADLPSFAGRVRRPKDPGSVVLVYGPTHDGLNGLASGIASNGRGSYCPSRPGRRDHRAATAFPTYIGYVDNGLAGIVCI